MFSLQNSSLSWYTDDPDLTKCFEKTVLIWIPCLFLWTFASLEVFYILHSKKRDIPWNWLNVLKLVGTGALFMLTVVDLGAYIYQSTSSDDESATLYNVDIYSPIIKMTTFVCIFYILFIYLCT